MNKGLGGAVLLAIVMIGVSGTAAAVAQDQATSSQVAAPVVETVSEIRVHGNATMSDEDVIRLAGVALGDKLAPDSLAAIEHRLRESDRFDDIEVRKRYRTLEMDQVALVLLVHEKPGVRPDGTRPGPFKRLRSRLMFLPIVTYDDGYGWTYGARTSTVDALGFGERLSVPLTWGATRRAALEAERTFRGGPLTRVLGSFGIAQNENPHFEVDDQRTEVRGRAERRLFGIVTAWRRRLAYRYLVRRSRRSFLDERRERVARYAARPGVPVGCRVRWHRLESSCTSAARPTSTGIGRRARL